MKSSKTYIVGVSLKERKENGTEAIFGDIRTKNSLKLMKAPTEIREDLRTPSRINTKTVTLLDVNN